MNIKKAIIMAVAFFAAVSFCQAKSLLAPSSVSGNTAQAEDEEEEDDSDALNLSELDAGDTLSFSLEDEDEMETLDGYEVLSEFLPSEVTLEWTGKKLKAPKAGKIKYSKKEGGFVDAKDSDNPSGLSIKVNKKKGTVSGSFKIYVAKSEKKVKSYTAKFSGKAGVSMSVRVKGKVVATAIIE